MNRQRFWHCRGPFFHEWGYNDAPFLPLKGCLRDGCDWTTLDYNERRRKDRIARWNARFTQPESGDR